jgi:hypothetical protein
MMDSCSDVLARLRSCTIANNYDGFELFQAFADAHPMEALEIGWQLLTSTGDPGRDGWGLCSSILETVGKSVGRQSIENRLKTQWRDMKGDFRRNFIEGFASPAVVSIECAICIFEMPATTVAERHRIAAILASERASECRDRISTVAADIGKYGDPERDAALGMFVQDVFRNFGLPYNSASA